MINAFIKKEVFAIFILAVLFFSCINRDGDIHTQSNPWDAGGDNFKYNQAPEYVTISGKNALWFSYDFIIQSGTAKFCYFAYDPNGVNDTITYKVWIGSTPDSLDSIYHGRDTACYVKNATKLQRFYYKITATDLYDSSCTDTGSFTIVDGTPPAKPSALIVSSYSQYLSMYWYPDADSHYRLYTSSSRTGTFTCLVDTIAKSTSTIRYYDYVNDYKAHYYVVTVSNQYGENCSDISKSHRYYLALKTPNVYSASSGQNYDTVKVSWYATSSSSNPKFYEIYRSESNTSGPYYCIGTTIHSNNSSSLTYCDTLITSANCYYKVAVFDTQDRGSQLSGYESGYFKKLGPATITASAGLYYNYVEIKWNAVSLAAKYYIYRSESSSGTYVRIDSCDTNYFQDISAYDSTVSTTKYYYKVSSLRSNNKEGGVSNYEIGYCKVFSFPGNVKASRYAYKDRIAVKWGKVPQVTYNVYRASGTSYSTYLLKATVTDTFYNDTLAEKDSVYYYKLSSKKGSVETSLSLYAIGNLLTYPKSFKITSYTTNNHLSWSSLISYVEGYHIYRSTNDTNYVRLTSLTSSYYRDYVTGKYYYKISSYTLTEESLLSPGVVCQTPPLPPDSVWADECVNYVRVGWSKVETADNYLIYRGTSSSTLSLIDSTTDTTYIDSNMSNTRYYYKIKAKNEGGGISVYSDYVKAGSIAKPLTPTNYYLSGSVHHITLSWLNNTSGSQSTGYYIYRSKSSSGTFLRIDTANTAIYYDTVPDTSRYYYRVSGYNSMGEGTQTIAKYSNRRIPSRPSNITVENQANITHIETNWSATIGAAGYYIHRSTTSSGVYTKLDSTTDTTYNDSTPSPNIRYYYKISAYSEVGESSLSNYAYGKLFWQSPLAPNIIKATLGTREDTITISWKPTTHTSSYKVYRDANYSFQNPVLVGISSDTLFHDTVSTDSVFNYKLKSVNKIGESVLSSTFATGYIKPSVVPGAPINVKADSLQNYIRLTWSRNISGTPTQSYNIYRSDSLNGTYDSLSTATSQMYDDFAPLTWPKYYWYYITAINITGESAPSDTVKGTRK